MSRRAQTALLLLMTTFLIAACGSSSKPSGSGDDDAGTGPGDAAVELPDASVDAGQSDGGNGIDPCQPNPCGDASGHRSRCLWDGQGGYECHCDVGFYDFDGLCCPALSSNQNGACVCNQGYESDGAGGCVVKCSEDSIEGLDGWCPEGEICVQGACVTDVCAGFDCPAHSTCVIRANEPFCLCEEGLHLSQGACCPLNATNVGGTCACDQGYVDQEGACVPDPSNPCVPVNPCSSAGLHRNTCVPDGTAQRYHCACNQGYVEEAGACVLAIWTSCPSGLVCRADVCVPPDLSQEQCLTDTDCHEYFPDAPTTCNASAAGGICLGCTQASDCPGNTQCTPYSTCAALCDDDSDCPYGRCYQSTGYCGQTRCAADADCFNGTVCIDDDGSGQGMCLRIPCVETECSPTNPNGTCADPGQSCLYGACVGSCAPNPCTQELNKTVCSTASGAPACLCDAGYELAADGRCVPSAASCPTDFACAAGFCADSTSAHFVCAEDADCGAGLTCSPTLPSGSCQGCGPGAPCPTGLDCVSGYCLQPCALDSECHAAMTCRASGYCGRKECSGPADCAEPYLCVGTSSGGTCQRPVCSAR